MLLVYLLISQLPAQFIVSILLLGQAISIISGKFTNHNFHHFLFLGPLKPVDAKWSHIQKCTFQHNIEKISLLLF